jgi:hypothetical protein
MKALLITAFILFIALELVDQIKLPEINHVDTTMQAVDCMVDEEYCNGQ